MYDNFDLDKPLFEIPESNGSTPWTIKNSFEGVKIFGNIGSGKSTGSGAAIARKYLENDYGGLVLCAKASEKDEWVKYCIETNRIDDLVIIEPNGKYKFNFIDYEARKSVSKEAVTENLVEVLKTVINSNDLRNGKEQDSFWQDALDQLMYNVIDLAILAWGKVSVDIMYELVMSAPKFEGDGKKVNLNSESGTDDDETDEEEKPTKFVLAFQAAQEKVNKQYKKWVLGLSDEKLQELNESGRLEDEAVNAIPDLRLLKFIDQFFLDTYFKLSEKTRSIVLFSFSGCLFRLMREPVYSLFCRGISNITPEDCLDGKIILLNLPVKLYQKIGIDSQVMFKYIWQRAMERRDVKTNKRPVFLFADECQLFLHPHDSEYQATARSSRISTVYLSQNLPNFFANMGGEKSQYKVKGFLGTLATSIFHSNTDMETNKYASELFGESFVDDESTNVNMSDKFSRGRTNSFKLEKMVRPEDFVPLKTGGKSNDFWVEGYFHRQGAPFKDGMNFKKVKYKQKF